MGEGIAAGNEIGTKKSEQELVKQLKRHFENWREVLLPIHSLIIWEKPFYPGILTGFVTFIFTLLWYFDPPILTTFSVFGILICILDYGVPLISASVFDSNKWTGAQECKYEDICKEIALTRQQILDLYRSVNDMKESKPNLFFVGVLITLFMTAWIGNAINNLFLTYLIAMAIVLLPGIRRHGILQQYLSQGLSMIKATVGQKKKKN